MFRRDRARHAADLKRLILDVEQAFEKVRADREEQNLAQDFGLILCIASEPGYPLKFTSFEKSPTQKKKGIVVLNVRHEPSRGGVVTKIALFVPFGRLNILGNKIDAYADPQKDTDPDKQGVRHPRNEALLSNVARIGVAALEALWTPVKTPPPSA